MNCGGKRRHAETDGRVLLAEVRHWSLTTLRDNLIKIRAKVVRHARLMTFQIVEVAVPRQLFREILRWIGRQRRTPASLAPR